MVKALYFFFLPEFTDFTIWATKIYHPGSWTNFNRFAKKLYASFFQLLYVLMNVGNLKSNVNKAIVALTKIK